MTRLVLVCVVISVGCEWEDPGPPEPICGDGVVEAEQCDDGNTESGDGCSAGCAPEISFAVDWRVASLASTETASCAPGFDLAVVTVAPHVFHACAVPPCADEPIFGLTTYEIDCSLGTKLLWTAFRGNQVVQHVSVAIASRATGDRYAASVPQRTDLSANPITSHVIYGDAGFVRLVWALERAGTRMTCASVGIHGISVRATPMLGGSPITFTAACPPVDDPRNELVSPPLPPGTYTIDVSGGGAQTVVDNVVVKPRGEITSLGVVSLEL